MPPLKDYVLPGDRCPVCGKHMDTATALSGPGHPTPGDFSICLNCGAILKFKNDLSFEVTTLNDMLQHTPVHAWPAIDATLEFIRNHQPKKGK